MKKYIFLFALLFHFGANAQKETTSSCEFTFPKTVQKIISERGYVYPVEISTPCRVKSTEIKVMNRWGQTVYTANNLSHDWQKPDSPSGVYYISLEGIDEYGKPFQVTGFINFIQ